ncbi:UDP-Glycosyltransferase [Datura stramonium]|uniref:UDP-Glycosyltransferase n=1 Tax=Datura stramonium TaxID=4076 RepID=A0ABS8UQ70_DATST|nr:UDP-Glycosyltransferase [Datura stramonium]
MDVRSVQPHFVLFPFMAQGHMIPMIDIARLLAQQGVLITILSTPSNANRFKSVIDRAIEAGLKIQGWAPQMLILSHPSIGGFLTHCGWNSSLEGVSVGVPMITWPMFADQFFNEKLIVNIVKTGVRDGIDIPVMFGVEEKLGAQVSKDDIKMVIEQVMGGEMEAQMRRKRAKEVGEMARRAMEEGGSSHFNLTQLIQDVTEQANI